MKSKLLALFHTHRQLVLYGCIGLSGATLDILFYVLFYRGLGIPPVIASFLSVSVGIINNFLLNTRYNFKVYDRIFYRFVNFYSIGLGGAILSSILILILFNGFGINATVAKLLTIVPVVLLQFGLNKRHTFKQLDQEGLRTHPLYRLFTRHTWLIVINILFIITALVFIANKAPEQSGPDEGMHYYTNVYYMIEHHSLPVSGRDDIGSLKSCRDAGYAIVRCTYTYMAYPAANYALNALSSWTLHEVAGIPYLVGSRLTALMEGLVFINVLYITALRLARNRRIAAAVTASIAFIPQVIFTVTYVNQDALSLTISSLIIYALVRFLQEKDTRSMIIAGAVFGGALPLVKFNFMLLSVVIAVVLLAALIQKIINLRHLLKLFGWCVAGFAVIAGFWYARNFILYHDFLGQSFTLAEMNKYHTPGVAKEFSWATLQEATQLNFFGQTFDSFYVGLGSMSYFLADYMYGNIAFGLVIVIIGSFYLAFKQPKALAVRSALVLAGLLLFIAASVGFSYYNSIVYDFQPQGRYVFPVLAPIALALAYLYRLQKQYKYAILGFLAITIYAFYGSIDVIVRHVLILSGM